MASIMHSFVDWTIRVVQSLIGREFAAEVETRQTVAFGTVLDAKRQRLDATLDAFDYVQSIPVDEQDEARNRVVAAFKADLIDMNMTFNSLASGPGKTGEEVREAVANAPFDPASSETSSKPGLGSTPPRKALVDEASSEGGSSDANGHTPPMADRSRPGRRPPKKTGGVG